MDESSKKNEGKLIPSFLYLCMASLANLIKMNPTKELSAEQKERLSKLKTISLSNYIILSETLNSIRKSLDDTYLSNLDSANDVIKIRNGVYNDLYSIYSEKINLYYNELVNLKKSGYSIPEITEKAPRLYKTSEKAKYRENYSYYGSKSKEADVNSLKQGEINWSVKINDFKEFDYNRIVEIMETLGFVIMPLDFLSDSAFSVDPKVSDKDIKNKLNDFKDFVKTVYGNFDIYILSPIKYLDLMKWAKCKDIKKTVIFAKSLSAVSLPINMNMPLFRSIFDTIDLLSNRVSTLEEKLDNELKEIKQRQNNVETNIGLLQNQLRETRSEMINRINSKTSELNERVKSLEAWRIACLTDPLVFAKGKDDKCVLGFAWGPEFPKSVLKEFGLTAYNN